MSEQRKSSWLVPLLLVLIAIVFIDQTQFLFSYPVPDTGMWFGDESWTMLTVRALARTGVAKVPEALGSSLAHSNGLVNGSIWVSGVLYGLPASLLSAFGSPVAIGRSITLLLSIALCFVLYRFIRSLNIQKVSSLIAIFVLIATDAFHFSSHSARLDTITGLGIILFLFWLSSTYARQEHAPKSFFLLSLVAVCSVSIYVHVPSLIALPAIYSVWRMGGFRRWQPLVSAIAGVAAGIAVITGLYWLSTGSLELLGKGYNQYYNVANSLPVLHLRSWRVQKINTIDRAVQVWQVAWPLVLALAAAIVLRYRSRTALSDRDRFVLMNVALVVVSWMLFEGPAVFYNIHVLPVFALATGVLLRSTPERMPRTAAVTIAALVVLVAFVTVRSQELKGAVGRTLVTNNHSAIHSLIDSVRSEARPPLILTDEPALNEIAGTPGVRLMTNHLLLFGEENKPLADILHEKHVDYLLLYSTVRWHSPFRQLADSLYALSGERVGAFTDQARSYEDPDWGHLDTLRLYTNK